MKYLSSLLMVTLLAVLISCSKKGGDSTSPTPTAPADFVVSALVLSDNSGTVAFTASANNSVTYDYDFGNGATQTVASGVVNYTYVTSGSYTVKITAKSKDGITATKSVAVNVTVDPAATTPPTNSSLIWSEEFNNNGAPDATKWGYDTGTGSNGWGNNELEYYTTRTDNAIVSNGTLKIIAKKESYNGSNYTSARLVTNTKFDFKYGKLEVRAKLPSGAGTWPAIWMLGSNFATAPWPACGEIDIMEQKGNEPNKIYGTLHYPGHSGGNGAGSTTTLTDASSTFHRYAVDWSPTTIKIMVDDVPFYTFANNSSLPFNNNFFIILNLAMGGTFGGSVGPNFSTATMEVDYVRLYKN